MEFTFAELLRSFRQRASLDQLALASSQGLHVNTISAWERGQYRPRDRERVLLLAEELSLSAAETDQLLRAADFPSAHGTPNPLTARHQLRAPVGDFVGRAAEIQRMRAALLAALAPGAGAVISGIRGMAGVGKTELAYQVAHQLRACFPDAQIVLDLRGASAAPLSSALALQNIIRSFKPDAALPTELPDLQRIYCSLLQGKRALILADDARDAAHVRALIPPAGCALLITSRVRFVLPGMSTIDLDLLGSDEAALLLQRICPQLRVRQATALAHACGYLPLALRVSGGIVRNDPALAIADYLARMADDQRRLGSLRDPDDPELDVSATLALGYKQLELAAQQAFRQLGVIVGDFAGDLGEARRAIGYYQQDLAICRQRGDRESESITLGNLGGAFMHLGETHQAIAYYEQARAISRALGDQRWEDQTLSNLAHACVDLGQFERAIAVAEDSRAMLQEIGEQRQEGYVLSALARAHACRGDHERARACFAQAQALHQVLGDRAGQAAGQWHVGLELARQGLPDEALPLLRAAVAYEREVEHAQAGEHAKLLARLEAGQPLSAERLPEPIGRAVAGI